MFQVVKSTRTKTKKQKKREKTTKQEFALWLPANPGLDCQHGVMRSQRESDFGGSDSWSRHVEEGERALLKSPSRGCIRHGTDADWVHLPPDGCEPA